jgi:hypothetical protein
MTASVTFFFGKKEEKENIDCRGDEAGNVRAGR